MNCDDALPLIAAMIDREIDPESRVHLEAHLAGCSACRTIVDAERALDADLVRASRPHQDAAARIAAHVLEALPAVPMPRGHVRRPWGLWVAILGSMAAGFALALVCFPPATPPQATKAESGPSPPVEIPVARLVAATGEVHLRPAGEADWRPVSPPQSLNWASGTSVRTPRGTACEVEAAGCAFRLNGETELAVKSAREVELRAGQLWCQSPPDAAVHVVSAVKSDPPAASVGAWSCLCPSDSSLLTEIAVNGQAQIVSARGDVDVTLDGRTQRLRSGEMARVENGELVTSGRGDMLLATAWMNPLLIRKGHRDAELNGHVDQMLARLGRAKMSFLYEAQIRGLGEYGVLPLLRFVQSDDSRQDAAARHSAMRILSDVAPPWSSGDLIGLLADEDPRVRVLAAKALERLTGESHGRGADDWTSVGPDAATAYTQWQNWWQKNRLHFVSPVVREEHPFPAPRWLKARDSFERPPTKS